MKQFRQKAFKCWIGLWVIILMIPIVFNQFKWLPIVSFVAYSTFLLWWGLTKVYPKIDWETPFDWVLAYVAISFFGSMMAFLLPFSYGYEQSLAWNNWCQVSTLIWLFSIIVGFILTLKEGWNSFANVWKALMVTFLVLFTIIFVLSLLGMCGICLV